MTQAHVRKKVRIHYTLSANTVDEEITPQSSIQHPSTLPSNNSLFTTMDKFVKSLYSHTYKTCELCHRRCRWSSHTLNVAQCNKCSKDLTKPPFISEFSSDNDMDPFFHSDKKALAELQSLQTHHQLNEIEQMLISLHVPIMKVYRLKGRDNGNLCFSGNVAT